MRNLVYMAGHKFGATGQSERTWAMNVGVPYSVAEAFREARRANLAAFARLGEAEWSRAGSQEGVGAVSLCDLPAMMAEHDRAHRAEIEAWRRARV